MTTRDFKYNTIILLVLILVVWPWLSITVAWDQTVGRLKRRYHLWKYGDGWPYKSQCNFWALYRREQMRKAGYWYNWPWYEMSIG